MRKFLGKLKKNLNLDPRRAGAFVFRDLHLTKRYYTWEIVFLFYAIVNSTTIVLIGVASGSKMQTLNLLLGVLMWSYLSSLFYEIANSISYERWEGTIEYTFMAPVSRLTHLLGVSMFASVYAIIRVLIIGTVLLLFVQAGLTGANVIGAFLVLLLSSMSFMGLGLMAATFPLVSTEKGAQATNILNGLFLLISGVYFPVSVLPSWIRPLSVISPATYSLRACRKMLGIGIEGSTADLLLGQSLSDVLPEIGILLCFGIVSIPLGLFVFSIAERWAKKTGKLKRSG